MAPNKTQLVQIPMSKSLFNIKSLSLSLFLLAFAPNWAAANPVLNQVVAGDVSVSQTPGSTVVTQQSARGVVDWHQFNVDANEKVHFQQPDGGVTLNRIDPAKGISKINGNLTATSQIILVNGAGIIFGPNAMVNVGGIIASAASGISIDNFMNGRMIFDQVALDAKGRPIPNGQVKNQGKIHAADRGLVALVGNSVINEGAIVATMGQVVLGSANKFTFSLVQGGPMDGLLNFSIDAPANQKKAGVSTGSKSSIIADGGLVLLTTKAVSKVLDNSINMKGVIQANSVDKKQGFILIGEQVPAKELNADLRHTDVKVDGKLSAKGQSAGESGGVIMIGTKGTIELNGEISAQGSEKGGFVAAGADGSVTVKKGTVIDVSAEKQGGVIILDSDEKAKVKSKAILKADATQGKGGVVLVHSGKSMELAGDISAKGSTQGGRIAAISYDSLTVDKGTTIDVSADQNGGGIMMLAAKQAKVKSGTSMKADSLKQGNGGHVFVGGTEAQALGKISAKGGPNGGNGGYVEVGGARSVGTSKEVDVSAPKGKQGHVNVHIFERR